MGNVKIFFGIITEMPFAAVSRIKTVIVSERKFQNSAPVLATAAANLLLGKISVTADKE